MEVKRNLTELEIEKIILSNNESMKRFKSKKHPYNYTSSGNVTGIFGYQYCNANGPVDEAVKVQGILLDGKPMTILYPKELFDKVVNA